MQIHALVHDLGLKAVLRTFFAPIYRAKGSARLVLAPDWPVLLDQARAGLVHVAVVDPCVGFKEPSSHEELSLLAELVGNRRVVLLVSPRKIRPAVFKALGGLGFRLVLIGGVDDERASVERALVIAATCAILDRLEHQLRGQIPDTGLELLLDALSSYRPGQDVSLLASALGMDREGFRRLMSVESLPCPRECLGWGRLFFALGCLEIRGQTVSRLAYRLGYEDRASLSRLCRRLTDRKATDLFSPGGLEIVVNTLTSRLTT